MEHPDRATTREPRALALWNAIRRHPTAQTRGVDSDIARGLVLAGATDLEQRVMDDLRGVDPDCDRALVDDGHVCRNRDGNEVRWGQACWASARAAAMREEAAELAERIAASLPLCAACGKPIDDADTVKCYGIDGSRFHPGLCFLAEDVAS